jgi:tetratricopeptide (TPR) repeat protein
LGRLGEAELATGNAPGAQPHLEKAVRYDPNSALAHLYLGDCYRIIGRLSDAKSELEAYKSARGKSPQGSHDDVDDRLDVSRRTVDAIKMRAAAAAAALAATASPQVRRVAPPTASAAATSIPSLPDPYIFVLVECVLRTRDGDPAVCRFPRPLDQMDFGQKHCDAMCAKLTR